MLTMLQFVQTLQDLEMFTEKYQDDLNDLAKIQVEMQLKTLSTWKQKTKGFKGALRAGMLLRGDSWGASGGSADVEQLSQEDGEAQRREAEEQERQRLEDEAMARQWAEKEQAMKDAMMREEEARLAAERLRAEEERLRAEEEAERKRLLKLKRLARVRARLAAVRRIQSTPDGAGSSSGGSAGPKFPYSGLKARPTRPAGREARAIEHGGPRYHTVEMDFSDEEMQEEIPHGAPPTHHYHGKPVAGAVGAAVEEQRRKNMVAARQPGRHWQPRQHGEAARAVPAMLNRGVVSVQDAAATAAAAMDRVRCARSATGKMQRPQVVVTNVALNFEADTAAVHRNGARPM
jgi:hypothetical protein